MDEKIAIILLTYERTEYALKTIKGIRNYLWPDECLWFIADDGSPKPHVDTLIHALEGEQLIGVHSEHHSYGHSANVAFRACDQFTPLTFWLEDDWELRSDFDLRPFAQFLVERETFGMVRLGYLNINMAGRAFGHGGQVYWHLDRDCDQYVFTGHPSLRHRRFMEAYGPYPEGLKPGETELAFATKFRTGSGPHIVWPANIGQWGPFAHIGSVKAY